MLTNHTMAKKVLQVTSRVAGLALVGILMIAFMINLVSGYICSTTTDWNEEDLETVQRFTRGAATQYALNKTSPSNNQGKPQQQQQNNNKKNKTSGGGNGAKRTVGCGWFKPRSRGKVYEEKGHRIAGGFAAEPGEFPSFVRLTVSFGGFSGVSCGGTIISDRLILTAAHCLSSKNNEPVRSVQIFAGSVMNDMGKKFSAARWCLPPRQNKDWAETDMDIAVLITKQAIQFNEHIQPACLPSLDISSRSQGHVVGFGLTSKVPVYQRPNELQVLPVVRTNQCPGFIMGRNAVCYISNYRDYAGDACEGDSGGPVYATISNRQSVVAVVSSGINNCAAGKAQAGIYMNVFTLDRKIREIVRNCQATKRPSG